MRIFYMSDVHLEFGAFNHEMPTGDVLLLAGDITLASAFADWDRGQGVRERTRAFFSAACKNFGRVYYIIGNHEGYGADVSRIYDLLRPHVEGAQVLDCEAVQLRNDVVLFAGTMWTEMGGKDTYTHRHISSGMNDFRLIRNGDKPFSTYDAAEQHARFKQLLSETASRNRESKVIVMSHHAPHTMGLNSAHAGGHLDAGYFQDMTEFMEQNPNITHWVHGHTHSQTTYRVGNTQVFTNARGYVGREMAADWFSPDKFFEV